MAIVSGFEKTAVVDAINQAQRVVNMKDKIFMLEPSATPLTLLISKLNKASCFSPKFEWLEDRAMPITDTVNGTSTAAQTTVIVDTVANFHPNSLWKVAATSEVVFVSSIDTTNSTLTVVRSIGSAPAAQIDDGATLVYLGGAAAESALAEEPRQVTTTNEYNYTQIFRTGFAVSNTEAASKLYGGPRLPYLHKARGIDHAKGIELAFLFGGRDIHGSEARRYTGGVQELIATNSTAMASVDHAKIQNASVVDFRYGSSSKMLFTSRASIKAINIAASVGGNATYGQLTAYSGDKTFGLDIRELIAVGGRYNLVPHDLFVADLASLGLVVDLDNMAYRYLEGRDTKLRKEIQANDRDGRQDEFISEVGLERRLEESHAEWTGITSLV